MMSRFSKLVAAAGVTMLAGLGVAASPASASCAQPVPMDQALTEASFVFVGTVTEVRFDDRYAVFDVEEVWRGDLSTQVEVNGGPTVADLAAADADGLNISTSVDRTYVLGQRYLVVSHGLDAGALADNACSATTEYAEDLDRFRPADSYLPSDAPADESVPDDTGRGSQLLWFAAGAGLVLAASAAAALWRRSTA